MNARSPCDRLDDYLAGDLPETDRREFGSHLQACPECRDAVRFHESLAGNLRAAVAAEVPAKPIAAEVSRRQSLRRRRQWLAVAALAASIVGTIFVDTWRSPTVVTPPEIVQAPATSTNVTVSFPSNSVLTVPAPISEPGITVMWVYPVVRVAAAESRESNQPIERNVP